MRTIGTVVRGVRAPIIREGDNIAEVAAASVMEAWKEAGIEPRDRDVVAVTESVVARAQGNYATLDQIAKDVREKTGGGTVGVAFPILSRNRFSLLLRGMAMGCKKIVLLLSYPSDEVGNGLVDWDKLDEAGVDPYSDVLTLEQFREKFGAAVQRDGKLACDHGLADAALAGHNAEHLADVAFGVRRFAQGLRRCTLSAALAAGRAIMGAFAHRSVFSFAAWCAAG